MDEGLMMIEWVAQRNVKDLSRLYKGKKRSACVAHEEHHNSTTLSFIYTPLHIYACSHSVAQLADIAHENSDFQL